MATEFLIEGRYRGDTIEFDFRVTKDGDPVDLEADGLKLWFTAKTDPNAEDSQGIQHTLTDGGIFTTDAADGRGRVRLAPVDTATMTMPNPTLTLYCDLQIKEPDEDVYTLADGQIIIKRDLTRDYA